MPQSAAQKFPWWSAGCGSIGERDVDGVMGHDGGSMLSPEAFAAHTCSHGEHGDVSPSLEGGLMYFQVFRG